MALATQTINLDLRPHYNRQNTNIVYCSQYDSDLRNVVVNIADAGTAVNVSTYTIYVEGTKPDKHGFSYELTSIGGTVANNVVTFPLQLQMTAVAGITNAELVFYSDDERIGSANFILAVEQAGLADDIDVSDTDIPAYVDGAQRAAEAAEDAKDLAVAAKDTAVAVAASIPEDYTTLSNDVDDLKSALFDETTEAFTYNAGTAFVRLAPYMATEKYGIRTLATLSSLSFKFQLALNYSVSVRFEIRDADGNVYGTITNAYTVAQSGDYVDVDITFDFDNNLSAGQYYLWLFSSAASTLSYGYSAGTFPSYRYIELTADGGWNNGVNSTTVTSYRMLLSAEISGVAVLEVSKFDTVEIPYERVNRQIDYDYDSNVNGWTIPSTYWTNNGDGSVTLNYTGTGNSWASSSWLFSETVINLMTEFDIEIETGDFTVYVQGVNSSGNTVCYNALTSVEQGHITVNIDIAYLSMYTSIDVTKPIKVLIANYNAPTKFTISNWVCYYDEYHDISIMGDTLIDTFRNIQNNLTPTMPSTALTSPNGSKYVLSVSDNGTVSVTPIIPSKTLFVGNSLLTGNGFGMNATDVNHDYYHYVTGAITAEKSTATFTKMSGTGFESCETESAANTWMANTLLPNLSNDLDLVIVQLGDNVNTAAKVSAFTTNCANLLRYIRTHCPSARVAWVGEWYQTAEKQSIISNACSVTGCVFVDISDLAIRANQSAIGIVTNRTTVSTVTYTIDSYSVADGAITITFTVGSTQYTSVIPSYTSYTENSSTSLTVTSNYIVTTNSGVASHPSDTGMLKVANRICYVLGITDSETAITA